MSNTLVLTPAAAMASALMIATGTASESGATGMAEPVTMISSTGAASGALTTAASSAAATEAASVRQAPQSNSNTSQPVRDRSYGVELNTEIPPYDVPA